MTRVGGCEIRPIAAGGETASQRNRRNDINDFHGHSPVNAGRKHASEFHGIQAVMHSFQSLTARKPQHAIGWWLLAVASMIARRVVLGGLPRLTVPGLSIPECHPVTGVIPPLSDADWHSEFAKYQ